MIFQCLCLNLLIRSGLHGLRWIEKNIHQTIIKGVCYNPDSKTIIVTDNMNNRVQIFHDQPSQPLQHPESHEKLNDESEGVEEEEEEDVEKKNNNNNHNNNNNNNNNNTHPRPYLVLGAAVTTPIATTTPATNNRPAITNLKYVRGHQPGQFAQPAGVCYVSSRHQLVVVDCSNNRLQLYDGFNFQYILLSQILLLHPRNMIGLTWNRGH